MGKERNKNQPEDVLAENYKTLRDLRKGAGLWKGPGVSPKTANNVEKARHNTKLQTIIRLADALGVEPFQMLLPVKDKKFLAVLQAWAQTDENERDNLHAIAEAMLKRKSENAHKPGIPVPNPKRDRAG